MILTFATETEKDQFLSRLARERTDIHQKSRAARTRKAVTVQEPTEEQSRWLEDNKGSATIFLDTRFDPMASDSQ